jgi:hypothetical protein
MRIIGEHIKSPHENLVRKDGFVYNRVNVSRQRNTAAQVAVWRADVERETSAVFISLGLDGEQARG